MGSNLQLNNQIEDYINNHSLTLHPVQNEIIKYNENLGKIKKMQISVSQCHFLHLIVKILNPKNILEIGTFTGLSTLTMALAIKENSFITALDKNEETSKIAKKFFYKANVGDKIKMLVNNANASLEEIIESKKYFDLIFIDADKENYINYFQKSLSIINKSGVIIIDNVLWYGDVADSNKKDRLTVKIREFNSFVKNNKIVENLILPIGDGLSVCRTLCRQGDKTPILILTARHQVSDRVSGLDAGADDYLAKPFALDELLARIRALLRRNASDTKSKSYVVSNLVLNIETRQVLREGRELDLTKTEFDLLELLMRNENVVLTREMIYDEIWGFDFETNSKSLDVYVGYLRRKVDNDPSQKLIHTIRGIGYCLRK